MSRLFDFAGGVGMGYSQPDTLMPKESVSLPASLIRKDLPRWPRLSEPEMVRHYTWLSRRNFGIDTGFYPLGSCTMKHNPRVNEVIAQIPGIAQIHPHQPEHHLQGLLSIFHEMQHMLEICWEWTKLHFNRLQVLKESSLQLDVYRNILGNVEKISVQK